MASEIGEYSHPDSLWTWKSNARSKKASLWIPYFEKVEKIKGTTYRLSFQGGPLEVDLKQVDCICLYGAAGVLPVEFMDALATRSISLLIHRRNVPVPMVMVPSNTTDQADVLTRQIVFREDARRRLYIAKTLIASRIESMRWLSPLPVTRIAVIRRATSIERLRQHEAELTKVYWSRFYNMLGVEDIGRRAGHPLNAALDAGSFFLFGVLLRWVLFHRLSPAHGFMHSPTEYQSLVYDLMEPYRYMFEQSVAGAWLDNTDAESLTARSLDILKTKLVDDAYVGAARATAKRKSLLHAVVLALRAYLLGEMQRFVVPSEGGSLVGRPPKLSYGVPGARTALRKPPGRPPGRDDVKEIAAAF